MYHLYRHERYIPLAGVAPVPSSSFTDGAQRSLEAAAGAAAQRDQRSVEPRHLLLALAERGAGELPRILERLGVTPERLLEAVTRSLPRTRSDQPPDEPPDLPYTHRAESVLEAARREARSRDRSRVDAADLFVALATERGITRTLLRQCGLEEDRVRDVVSSGTDDEAGPPAKRSAEPPGVETAPEEAGPPDAGGEPGAPSSQRPEPSEPTDDDADVGAAGGGSGGPPAFRRRFERSRPPRPASSEDEPPAERPAGRRGRLGSEPGAPGAGESPAVFERSRPEEAPPEESEEEPAEERAVEPEGEEVAGPGEEAGTAPIAELLRPDEGDDAPLYAQIARGVREAVAAGHLESGARLPSVRDLAGSLSVSAGTAARAYSELEALGVVTTRGRRGTFVADPSDGAPARRERIRALAERLRPSVVDAFHLGASPDDLRSALEEAMEGILT